MYRKYYGFLEEPFALNPDPRFLFLARSHFEALSSMISGIKERKGIIVVTGEVGVGKTLLLHTLLKDLSQKIKTAFIFNSNLDLEDLLATILRDLEAPVDKGDGKASSPIHQFERYLVEQLTRDETVTVLIDEAQNLEERVLEGLFRFCSPAMIGSKILQIVLVGHPELEIKLNCEKFVVFQNRMTVRSEIHPLSREESRGYIKHRLKLAGANISDIFTSEAVERIWKFSEGIPRVINSVCDRALLLGFTNSNSLIDSRLVKEAIQEVTYLRPGKPRFVPRKVPQKSLPSKTIRRTFRSFIRPLLRSFHSIRTLMTRIMRTEPLSVRPSNQPKK